MGSYWLELPDRPAADWPLSDWRNRFAPPPPAVCADESTLAPLALMLETSVLSLDVRSLLGLPLNWAYAAPGASAAARASSSAPLESRAAGSAGRRVVGIELV